MVHGDAAMSAQGVVPETLVLSQLPEYTVGNVYRPVRMCPDRQHPLNVCVCLACMYQAARCTSW
jgi:hypothetical protein